MTISVAQLKLISPLTPITTIQKFIQPINDAMEEFEINNKNRVCAFLAQILHESAGLYYVKEIASGRAYEGRKDLGNIQSGDGVRYKGRGLIQITGRANYKECGEELGVDLLGKPELLEQPVYAALSAAWFWYSRGLSEIADAGTVDAFKEITHIINGGYNGLYDRTLYWNKANSVIV